MKMQLYQGRPADMTGRQDKEKRVYEFEILSADDPR